MGGPQSFNQGPGIQTQKINFTDIMSPVTKNTVPKKKKAVGS